MKLLFCAKCQDMFTLRLNQTRICACGESEGQYIDDINAVYSGDAAYPVGFSGPGFVRALRDQPVRGNGTGISCLCDPERVLIV